MHFLKFFKGRFVLTRFLSSSNQFIKELIIFIDEMIIFTHGKMTLYKVFFKS